MLFSIVVLLINNLHLGETYVLMVSEGVHILEFCLKKFKYDHIIQNLLSTDFSQVFYNYSITYLSIYLSSSNPSHSITFTF